jgi:hypothetical protein
LEVAQTPDSLLINVQSHLLPKTQEDAAEAQWYVAQWCMPEQRVILRHGGRIGLGDAQFEVTGISRKCCSNTGPEQQGIRIAVNAESVASKAAWNGTQWMWE